LTQALVQDFDGFEAHCSGVRMASGRYVPTCRVFEGKVSSGVLIHRQDHRSFPSIEYATLAEALNAAAESAVDWLQVHRVM